MQSQRTASCFAYGFGHLLPVPDSSRDRRVVLSQVGPIAAGALLTLPELKGDRPAVLAFVATRVPTFLPPDAVRRPMPCPAA
jgi:hypothetical protein